jgi:hypothetical protein
VTDPKKLLAARVNAPKNSSAQFQQKLSAGIAARKERGFSMTHQLASSGSPDSFVSLTK